MSSILVTAAWLTSPSAAAIPPDPPQDGTYLKAVPDDMDWYCDNCEPPGEAAAGAAAALAPAGATATKGTKRRAVGVSRAEGGNGGGAGAKKKGRGSG